ncbi:MAG TPA: VCBS repeat-containing protein [Verrucomicrobiales bacterium]|nr:VCBS repeat-containing protein [Verrucomicrobiales bacterium]
MKTPECILAPSGPLNNKSTIGRERRFVVCKARGGHIPPFGNPKNVLAGSLKFSMICPMKRLSNFFSIDSFRPTRLPFVLLALISLGSHSSRSSADSNEPQQPIQFKKILLTISANEGCAVTDVNRDGHLDVVAGRHWYAGPEYLPRILRHVEEFSDYLHSNGDLILDVNQDGWPDVVSSSFHDQGVWWYENPKGDSLMIGLLWKAHLLKKTHGQNEVNFFQDIDGDGTPELVVNRWKKNSPLNVYQFNASGDSKTYSLRLHQLNSEGNDHGMGFGDINGDNRPDILSGMGWWERPHGNPLQNKWKFHADWTLGGASCPMIVKDLNQDGRNDVIWGKGHDFGLYWREQLEPSAEGKTQWKEHLIDDSYSQAHCLLESDLDGDGKLELLTGKRVRAHSGKDPGGKDPSCLYYYKWDSMKQNYKRYLIDEGGGIGIGLQIRTRDMNKDGKMDIIVGGKSGTWVLLNQGRS